jgi:hypothetical protein
MKVTGFSFIRNAVKYDYPIVQAITSILPICDDFMLALGNSEDDTLGLVKSINSDKIKIINTIWDDSIRKGGRVLAQETDKAFDAIPSDTDWAFYIQGDEVIHEKYLNIIYDAMKKYKDDPKVDGLLLNYTHFFGSYDYVGDARRWYRREIRVIKNNKNIRSYKDAQGFRMSNNKKLKVKLIDAYVYHYGWVKNPYFQQKKQENFGRLYDPQKPDSSVSETVEFDYSFIDSLKRFEGTHPEVMKEKVTKQNWNFVFDTNQRKLSARDSVLMKIEDWTGWRIGEYKNYKKI